MNIAILKGNLTRDPELRYIPSGTAVAEFAIAVNRKWTTESGEKKEDVTFLECRAWGGRGETLSKFFTKGKPILIHGRIAQEQWEDKETGKKRSKTLIIVESWEFCGDTSKSGPPPAERREEPPRQPADTGPMSRPVNEDDDDIPF